MPVRRIAAEPASRLAIWARGIAGFSLPVVLLAVMVLFLLMTCFSAVYLQHHYVLDVLAGMSYAFAGYRLERWLTARKVRAATERPAA